MFKMSSFVDELIKMGAVEAAPGLLRRAASGLWGGLVKHRKPIALVGTGGAAVLAGQRGVEDIQMAEQMRKQMAQ